MKPLGGPKGGRAWTCAPSKGSMAVQKLMMNGPETAEGDEPGSASQATGPNSGSWAGGGGSALDSDAQLSDSGAAAAAAEQLSVLQLDYNDAKGSSSGAAPASLVGAGTGRCGPSEVAPEGPIKDEEAEEGGSGASKAHGGPASAPRLGASASKGHLSAQPLAASHASKRLSFSAPPKCLLSRPRLGPRANFSHSAQRVRQILQDNAKLVKRLGSIAVQQPEHELDQQQHDQFMANVAASSETRRAQEARAVMRSNLAIYKRLQEVKPSRDVARASLDLDFAKHERMLATLAAVRRRSRVASQPGSGGRKGGQPSGRAHRDSASPNQRASASAAAEQAAQ